MCFGRSEVLKVLYRRIASLPTSVRRLNDAILSYSCPFCFSCATVPLCPAPPVPLSVNASLPIQLSSLSVFNSPRRPCQPQSSRSVRSAVGTAHVRCGPSPPSPSMISVGLPRMLCVLSTCQTFGRITDINKFRFNKTTDEMCLCILRG